MTLLRLTRLHSEVTVRYHASTAARDKFWASFELGHDDDGTIARITAARSDAATERSRIKELLDAKLEAIHAARAGIVPPPPKATKKVAVKKAKETTSLFNFAE